MLTIAGKALGRKAPLFADWSIPLPPDWHESGGVTLRQIITQIVCNEVSAFRTRQEARQVLRVLTAREIQEAAERGKVEMGDSEIAPQPVDEEAAVATALQAFEDGIYLVVIDDEPQERLDSEVRLRPDSRITFVRLTLLAGG